MMGHRLSSRRHPSPERPSGRTRRPSLLDVQLSVPDVLAPLAITTLLFAGLLKATPILRSLPIDLTLLGAILVVLLVVLELVRREWRFPAGLVVLAALWATFFLGLWQGNEGQYPVEKVQRLFTLTLLSAIGALLLLTTERRQKIWVWTLVAVGALTTLVAIVFPSVVTLETGRLAADGGNTISAGQAAGVSAVILCVAAATRMAPLVVAVPSALLFAGATVLTGSKGPLTAMILALSVLVLVRPGTRAVRSRRVVASLSTAVAALALTISNVRNAPGFERIAAFVARPDEVREYLYSRSTAIAADNPLGIGWGNFSRELGTTFAFETAESRITYPHNIVLEVAVEAGWLPALALLVFVSVSLYRLARRSGTAIGAVLLAVAVYFFINSLVSSDINGNRMMFAAMALAWVELAPDVARPARRGRRPPSSGDQPAADPAPVGAAGVVRSAA